MKRQKMQGDQLLIDESLSDAPKTDHKPVKKPFKISPLYRRQKPNV